MADRFLYLHGWATDARVWDETARAVKAEFLAPNLPGHGGVFEWDGPSLSPAVREIKKALGESGWTDVIGVGWSLGALSLLGAALEDPSAFRAIVLVGATPCFTARDGFPHGQSRALVKRMITDMKKDPGETLKRFYGLNFTQDELATVGAKRFIERYGYPGPIDCSGPVPGCFPTFKYDEITTALEALCRVDLRADLSGLNMPCLVMHGSSDNVCPVGAGGYLAAHIRGARFVEFKGAGHAPFMTRPDRFAAILKDFVTGL